MNYDVIRIKGGTDNCYIITDGKNAILADTSSGGSFKMVMDTVSKYDLKLIVLTHPHFDHAENADAIARQFNIPVAYNKADDEIFDSYDAQPLKSYGAVGFVVLTLSLKVLRTTKVTKPENLFFISEGDTFAEYGFPDVKVIELPGHTKGSIGLLAGSDKIIVGDALDNWISPGMGHLYYDKEVQQKTYEKIRSFSGRTAYYGHGKPTVLK
ncbi:MAG: MBL fold metallo-hydrolase [Lachnospiraceae bacterium]|nr:MBL fold metallo-hydrolase [Lachnospiraceae bacterium]